MKQTRFGYGPDGARAEGQEDAINRAKSEANNKDLVIEEIKDEKDDIF